MSDLKYPLLAIVADPIDGFVWAVSHSELVADAHVAMPEEVVVLDHRDVGEVALGKIMESTLDEHHPVARWIYAHELHLLSLTGRRADIERFVVGIREADLRIAEAV